ncbi:protein kinase domain protein [Ichthyophthirius multifiliis]|uniref:Protein kinase domain protein n=1 Tax=Ichthyophthirius multifiliis TaxID=5932 RepID=G0QW08_ICHMU|nr:protein kinase domain protein [Ichthyophthirius multifiliis]EGR30601.1 protein kinase domain protein [Ichthyophthirius multifiliis]|eukprot:XP_004032188.1 protein kinase domain protein [Ichthyophthirius multifiliis]
MNNIKIIKSLGKGAHSDVFLSKDKVTGFIFAIKRVKKQEIIEIGMEEQFIQEIKIHMQLNHPNIVKLYGYIADQEYFYLLIEYCQGISLKQYVNKQSSKYLQEYEAAFYLNQVAEALLYLHKQNILHRDLKLENLMIFDGIIKLIDFGYSRKCDIFETRNTFCGTLDYLSPEIVNGEDYNCSVDIWAFGILSYMLLQGVSPFYKESQDGTIENILKGQFYFQRKISNEGQAFVSKLLNSKQEERINIKECLQQSWLKKFGKEIINLEICQQINNIL